MDYMKAAEAVKPELMEKLVKEFENSKLHTIEIVIIETMMRVQWWRWLRNILMNA